MTLKSSKTSKNVERRSTIITRTTIDKTLNRQIVAGGSVSLVSAVEGWGYRRFDVLSFSQ